MRLHAVLFSAAILTTGAAAQSTPFPDAPHDSRNEIPAVIPSQKTAPAAAAAPGKLKTPIATVNRPNTVCYAIRAYNFSADPASDPTKPTDVTTCQPARDASIKSAVLVRSSQLSAPK